MLLAGNPLEDIRNTKGIEAVVLGGRFLPRDALDALLEKVAKAAVRNRMGRPASPLRKRGTDDATR